jgi:hypothetical protein
VRTIDGRAHSHVGGAVERKGMLLMGAYAVVGGRSGRQVQVLLPYISFRRSRG